MTLQDMFEELDDLLSQCEPADIHETEVLNTLIEKASALHDESIASGVVEPHSTFVL